jgi:hypothetical protein
LKYPRERLESGRSLHRSARDKEQHLNGLQLQICVSGDAGQTTLESWAPCPAQHGNVLDLSVLNATAEMQNSWIQGSS